MHRLFRLITLLCAFLILGFTYPATAADKIRVGVLEFGTVNWELDVIQQHQLAQKYGFDLEVVPLASADASTVALQGGAVDVIVSDWVWVARQRTAGADYTQFPYSTAVGSVQVKPDSGIKTLAELKGKKLGVAGGPNDKSWLLLRAYALKTQQLDLPAIANVQFAAPPLLNELIQRNELDAVLNFWHYAARLQDAGLTTVITIPQVLEGLGIKAQVPLIGWVFSEKWAKQHNDAVKGFLSASYEAKQILKDSDPEWERLRPRMKADSDAIFKALRDAFRAGIPSCFGDKEKQAATDTFRILAETGGQELVGDTKTLEPGVFWSGFSLPACTP